MDSTEHVDAIVIERETARCIDEYYSRNIEKTGMEECMAEGIDEGRSEDMDESMGDCNNPQRPPKRNRQLDQDEVWTTVTRKGKRITRAYEADESIRIPDDIIEVNITSLSEEQLPKQFRLAKILKTENIHDITKVKYINPYKIAIQFSNESSADRLMES